MLPTIDYPIFKLTLPSTGQEIEYRPFLVKEEKLLLLAREGEDQNQILRTVEQVVNNCVLSPDVSVEDFTSYDLEYMFIKLRSASVNNIAEVNYRHVESGELLTLEIDLEEVVVNHSTRDNIIDLGVVKIKLKDVTLKDAKKINSDDENNITRLLPMLIDTIYNDKEVFKLSDYTLKEQDIFLEQLPHSAFAQVQEFVQAAPTTEYNTTASLKDGTKIDIQLKGLFDFF